MRPSVLSLPGRILNLAVATVLVTSLSITWISTRSTAEFLRRKIDDKFPVLLDACRERVDLWYGQRRLDLSIFAGSETLREQVPTLARSATGRRGARARAEVEQYLRYVLERFPQYDALFVLSTEGKRLIWIGDEVPLPEDWLDAARPFPERAAIGPLIQATDRRVQLVSARIQQGDRALGSLHASIRHERVDALLAEDGLSASGRIVAVDGRGNLIAPAGAPAAEVPTGPVEEGVRELRLASGERVIASAGSIESLGWTLWVIEPYAAAFAPVFSVTRRVAATNLAIVLILGVISFLIARSLVRPIHELSDAAARIAAGEEDVTLPVTAREDEVGVLTRALVAMTERLEAKTAEVQRANEVLLQLAVTDELTSLHNHRAFLERLEREIGRARRSRSPLCLLLADIDDFKQLNDRHGHAAGDAVLRVVAERMAGVVREIDFVARYGGEEFAILTPETGLEGAKVLAEKVRAAISEAPIPLPDSAESVTVTASFGVALFAGDDRKLFMHADAALYEAKAAGKDCVVAA